MAKPLDLFVSVVLVSDKYTTGVHTKIQKTAKLLKAQYANYEIILIDNGLVAAELAKCKDLLPKVPCIRIVRLARNEDIDTAVFAGIEAAIGDIACILYNQDPVELIPAFVTKNISTDIIFGIATNLNRKSLFEKAGAKFFYWYSRKVLGINVPNGSTYLMCINRNVINALTRNSRNVRHIRQLAALAGFNFDNIPYELPESKTAYNHETARGLVIRALDMVSGYSSHPLRALTYIGAMAGALNLLYACYVVIVNLSLDSIERGWTTLSLQSSLMFFLLFLILAVLSEYVGKILVESRNEASYHIMQELSSTISIADETRRNITK